MTPRAIGHGGWTGTSVWIDPSLDLFVVVLGNRRHPFGKTPNIYPDESEAESEGMTCQVVPKPLKECRGMDAAASSGASR